ncbi:alkaline phosphatase [Kribbella sandramycini]|uniref:Alkaline phosphatase n=1 Tax=Kribbella sandramycini TaxID=60450 RepID=A0A7Y4NZ92_9ACTN|nr:alkaline phosphatase [Kribbella sandramycini]MBB6567644.1 alkaline phosphatase [Kribbella sandramycini]NOL39754.1 alkaline phosphatase [Kribbella sandramycini]
MRGLALAVALTVLGGSTAVAVAQTTKQPEDKRPRVAKNIIYIQGDGLGLGQRNLIRLATKGRYGELELDKLPVAGMVRTTSIDPHEVVTDSGASATALATGQKTINGRIGTDAAGRPIETILERAKKAGKSTGLVTTAQVTGASPASFAAHVSSRDLQSDIAKQYVEKIRPDVLLGGGEDWWYPKGDPGLWPDKPGEESRSPYGNLVKQAQRSGYTYVRNGNELRDTRATRLLGLFANEDMVDYGPEGVGKYAPRVPLVNMARKALDVLAQNPKGFFLFLEEEGIDGLSHDNNAGEVIQAGKSLEAIVAEVMRFVKTHPDTLIIINGDHETGGLSIQDYDTDEEKTDPRQDGPFAIPGSNLRFAVDWTTNSHSGTDTPLTASGPGSERLGRVLDNTEVFEAMRAAARI